MESNDQRHTAHEGSASPAHLSPSPPPVGSDDVTTPTRGSPSRPARPPPPKFSTNKQSDNRPPPRPLRPSAKSLSLPRGMRPAAAETARARAAKRRSVDDSSVTPNPRTLTRPFSFPGFDTEEGKEPRQLVELDQLVKEASKPARPRQPSDINRPRKPSVSRESPEKTPPTDAPANIPAASSTPPQENLKIEPTSNGTSSARTPPSSKPPSRPPRPFPPPTSAQLTARVAKKRPPPILGKKTSEPAVARPAQGITVIDTRSNDQPSTEQAKSSSTLTASPLSSPTLVLPPPPLSPPPVPPSPSRSTPPAASPSRSTPPAAPPSRSTPPAAPPSRSTPPATPPATTSTSPKQENHPLALAEDKSLNLPLDEQPKTTESTPIKTSSSASAVPNIVETDSVTEVKGKSKEAQDFHTEEKDTLSPMTEQSSSPQSKGRRLLNSMKKSLRLGGGRQRHTSAPGRSKTITSSPKMQRSYTTRESSSSSRIKVYDQTVYPDTLPQGVVSPLVVQCVAYLNREHVLKEEGLFRIPGDLAAIKKIRQQFIAGDEVDLVGEVFDPHTVAGLLKLHFREMRVSLIARGQTMAEAVQAVQKKQVSNFREIVQNLDSSHILTLRMLAELLCKISTYSDINHMTSGTLATSCGPSIFPYLPPSNANAIVKFLIDHCNEIFID